MILSSRSFFRVGLLLLAAGTVGLSVLSAHADEPRVLRPGKGWILLEKSGDAAAGEDLAELRAMIAAGRWAQAETLARSLADGAADPTVRWQARKLLGDVYLLTDQMTDARLAYDAVLAEAPETSAVHQEVLQREYELAWQWLVGGRKRKVQLFGLTMPLIRVGASGQGLELLRELRTIRSSRDEDLPVRSLLLSAEYHFGQGEYDLAEPLYRQLQERVPERSEALTARMQEAVCLLAQFRGTTYDMEGLALARRQLADIAARAPQEAARVGVPAIIRQIDWAFARRDYDTGEFYRQLGDFRPAIRYYRYIAREYPGSPWQQLSQKRLAELGADDPAGK